MIDQYYFLHHTYIVKIRRLNFDELYKTDFNIKYYVGHAIPDLAYNLCNPNNHFCKQLQ